MLMDLNEIGDGMLINVILKLISFMGLIVVGCYIGEIVGCDFKWMVFEFGGNNLFVIFLDVDVDCVVDVVIFGKFIY